MVQAHASMPGPDLDPDFRPQATQMIAVGGLLVMLPLAGVHFAHANPVLGSVSLGVVVVLCLNAWYLRAGGPAPRLAPRLAIAAAGMLLDLYLLLTQGMSGLLWGYPTVLWLHCTLPERPARFANLALLACSLPLMPLVAPPEVALRAALTLVSVSVFSCVLLHVISRQQERLREQLLRDPLTGLLNRHLLERTLSRAIARTRRDGTPTTLLAIDLDHFKRVNDELGHEAGDTVLRGLGALLRTRLRVSDTVFRLGGEEFLVLLHATGETDARWIAETLLGQIREAPLLPDRRITASIGLATLGPEREPKGWLAHADEALYRAKGGGRDCVARRDDPLGIGPRPPARTAEASSRGGALAAAAGHTEA